MKILIIGDSFAADWTVKYKDKGPGWPNLLGERYHVVNLARAGVGEYKILKQLQAVKDIETYDCIIVSHTSPYRVNTRQHPVHYGDKLHHYADLMYGDIEYHRNNWTLSNFFNTSLKTAFNFFQFHFDEGYQETVYRLLRQEINRIIGSVPCIVVSNLNVDPTYVTETDVINLIDIQQKHPGLMNHLSPQGNELAFNKIIHTVELLTAETDKDDEQDTPKES